LPLPAIGVVNKTAIGKCFGHAHGIDSANWAIVIGADVVGTGGKVQGQHPRLH